MVEMNEERYKVLRSVWFSPQAPPMQIGVVAIETGPNQDKWKAYIGMAGGTNVDWDEQFIAAYGAKLVDKTQAAAFFPDLEIGDFVT